MDIGWGCSANPDVRDAMAAWGYGQIDPDLPQDYENCVCLGAFEDGKLIGCVIFNNYDISAKTIEFTMAATSRRWVNFRLLEEMRRYVFDDLGLQLLITKTKERNKHISRMLKSYGFSEYLIPRLFGENEGGLIFTLTKEQAENSKIGRRGKRDLITETP
jgi:RimJ/RimL family protein N-acetyltransferase